MFKKKRWVGDDRESITNSKQTHASWWSLTHSSAEFGHPVGGNCETNRGCEGPGSAQYLVGWCHAIHSLASESPQLCQWSHIWSKIVANEKAWCNLRSASTRIALTQLRTNSKTSNVPTNHRPFPSDLQVRQCWWRILPRASTGRHKALVPLALQLDYVPFWQSLFPREWLDGEHHNYELNEVGGLPLLSWPGSHWADGSMYYWGKILRRTTIWSGEWCCNRGNGP